jgi:TrpR-related protein YerC/YecD
MTKLNRNLTKSAETEFPTPENRELFRAIHTLESEADIKNFFRDLLTLAELKEFSNRWQMVKLLSQGIPYLEIAGKLKVSTTTVQRVAYWLNHGTGGYKKALTELKNA